MKVYIAGPMRGYAQFNFPMFMAAAEHYRLLDDEVFNPAEHDLETHPDLESWEGYEAGDTTLCPAFSLREALAWDLTRICECDAIILLPGWEKSSGVSAELACAKALGLEVWEFNPAVLGAA